MKFKVKDTVKITAGKDKGKQGKIKQVLPRLDKVVVAGMSLYKKHLKPRQTGGRGQIIERERPLPTANIALICPQCRQPTRVGYRLNKNGHKQRFCRKCQAILGKTKK